MYFNEKRRYFNGKPYLLEESILGDYSLIKAYKADKNGNLVFRKSARNFNPDMLTAGKTTIVEVEEIVEVGEIEPDQVHMPGIFVDKIFKGENYAKKIERRTVKSETGKIVDCI